MMNFSTFAPRHTFSLSTYGNQIYLKQVLLNT